MLKLCSCYVARVFLSHLFIIPYFFDFKQVLRQALNLFFTRERRTEEWDLKDTTSSPSASSFESSKLVQPVIAYRFPHRNIFGHCKVFFFKQFCHAAKLQRTGGGKNGLYRLSLLFRRLKFSLRKTCIAMFFISHSQSAAC